MGRRHHYVPQVYLRRFEASDGKVWLYDTEESRTIHPGPTGIVNVGQEKGFYALPRNPEYPDDDPEILEKQLAEFEAGFVESMEVAVRIAEGGSAGTLEERARLAKTVAFQHLRTRAWRDRINDLYKTASEKVLNTVWAMACEFSGREYPSIQAKVNMNEDRAWALQAQAMWSDDTINKLAERIYRAVWIIALNRSDRPFLTSDSPVVAEEVVTRESTNSQRSNPYERIIEIEGWLVPGGAGTQAFLPITPRHALIMLDPNTFSEVTHRQGQVLCVGARTVDQINAAQVAYCQRWVYASSEDFSGAVPPSDYSSLPPQDRRLIFPE